jgi:alpha-beta hydrolase superfamily lysophospholipase
MRDLRARRIPFIAVNLEPLFGSIDHYARIIEAAVARREAATDIPVLLVGHSMGGLAIRAWLRQFEAHTRVHRAITIGRARIRALGWRATAPRLTARRCASTALG